MAQRASPRTGLRHRESIADLVNDLELLRVDTNDYGDTKDSMARARDLKIEELKKRNGTLLEVCFSYVHKKDTILKSPASLRGSVCKSGPVHSGSKNSLPSNFVQ